MMSAPHASFPPGPRGLSLLANLLAFQYQPLKFFRALEHTYGRMTILLVANRSILFVFRPEHIRYFLVENPRNFAKPCAANNTAIKLFLGDGLLTTDGDLHWLATRYHCQYLTRNATIDSPHHY